MVRKPRIFLLVLLPTLVVGGVAVIAAFITAFAATREITRSEVPELNGLLIALPAFVLWIPVCLMLCNLILHAIPPLRRRAEAYSAEARRGSLRQVQMRLLTITSAMGIICVPLIVAGFLV